MASYNPLDPKTYDTASFHRQSSNMLNSFPEITETLRRRPHAPGPRVKVLHRASGETTEIINSFPENLAVVFSNKLTTVQIPSYGKAILLSGATLEAYVAIFDWMLACAEAKTVLHFPKFNGFVFWRATRVSKAAQILEIQDLLDAMEARLRAIARLQVHTDDVWRIYTDLDCAEYKDMVAKSIARALFEKRLKAFSNYRSLRYDMPNFDDDVRYELDCLEEGAKVEEAAQAKSNNTGLNPAAPAFVMN